ncbi:MAG: BlaI/MecI/CopY family transcriptional regulator [Candidatus Bathyarchaeia archaeon]
MELGTLELKTLKIVEKLCEASARDVLTEINKSKSLAYTTISTTLERLNKKGFLDRRAVSTRGGFEFVYFRIKDIELQKNIINSTLDRLVDAFGSNILSTIYQRLEEISPEELSES